MRDDVLSPPTSAGRAPCWNCAAPLAGDQRYCLTCGSAVADVAGALAPAARRPAAAPVVRGRPGIPLPGAGRAAAAALCGAVAVGILAGIGASPSGPVLAAQRVVVARAVAAPAAPAATKASGDLGSLQATATAATAAVRPDAAPHEPAAAARPAPAPSTKRDRPKAAATTEPPADATPPSAAGDDVPPPRPPVKHVVVVALADAGAAEVFGPGTRAPYLARELRGQGVLLRQYHAIAHGNLPNLIGLLSGQGANPATDAGCPALTPFVASGRPADDGQLPGAGCVFAAGVPSLPAQLDQAKLGWRAYVEGADPPADVPPAPCPAPAPAPGPDGTPPAVDRDPLLFLAAVAATPDCTARVAGFGGLAADLTQPAAAAPAFTLVVPDACDGGRDGACPPGEPAGIQRADAWLRAWIPQVLAAPAYADDGLVVVTFAEARATGELADSSSCCGEPAAVNEPPSADPRAPVAGGGRVGAIVLSPHASPGTSSDVPYDHFALLRTIEDAFGLDHLGLAAAPDLRPLGDDVFGAAG